jgi:diguanylate cyclase (GGDEF)-like protein
MASELKRVMSTASDLDEQPKRLGIWRSHALHGYAEWLTGGPDTPSSIIQHQLLLQSMTAKRSLVACVVVTTLTASVAAALTAEWWAYALVLANICIGCICLWVVTVFIKAEASGRRGDVVTLILAWVAYFSLTAAGCYQCVASGDWPLISMAGFGLASVIGAISSHSAGTPRFAFTLVCILMVPFSLACLISPVPHLFMLGIQLPLFSCAVTFGMFQNYRVLLHLYQSESENRRLAQHDLLTGLPNRALNLKHFDQLLAGLRPENGGLGQKFTVFCLDLDGFKNVNDQFGHAAGDAVLVAVAQRLCESVRKLDFVARVGGDEFVVLLPGISAEGAADIAARIIANLAAPFDIGPPEPIHIGITIGSACAPGDGKNTDELLHSADRALYEAKRRGRGIFLTHRDLSELQPAPPAADAGARATGNPAGAQQRWRIAQAAGSG